MIENANLMTNTKYFSVFAIVAVAAIMGVASIAPALAERTVKTNDLNVTFPVLDFSPAGLCGDDIALRTIHIQTKEWNNGKVVFHINVDSLLGDFGAGELVGTSSFVLNFVGDTDDFPLVLQANATVECVDGSTPLNEHFGFTVDRNGEVHPHFPTI